MIGEKMCRVSLYAPKTDRSRWEKLAKEKETSLSRLLYAAIEEGLAEKPDTNAVREVGELREKVAVLQEVVEWKTLLLERQERLSGWLEEDFRGVRRSLDPRLIAALNAGPSTDMQLMARMGILPSDTEETRAIGHQLEVLELAGLVTRGTGGWRWKP